MNIDQSQATLLEPKSGKTLAKITFTGAPIQVDTLMSASGSLQGFTILSSPGPLWDAWFHQKAVLLRNGKTQQLIKIVTYPTSGNNEGYLDFIPGTMRYFVKEQPQSRTKPKLQSRRWLALLQTLLSP
jgi:hypothetical protein